MATNLDLDDELVEAAQKLGRHETKREAVNRALDEYVRWLRQQAISEEFGTIQYDPEYDYKKQRKVA
jgi:Arc/MetJ family transcription regulator